MSQILEDIVGGIIKDAIAGKSEVGDSKEDAVAEQETPKKAPSANDKDGDGIDDRVEAVLAVMDKMGLGLDAALDKVGVPAILREPVKAAISKLL